MIKLVLATLFAASVLVSPVLAQSNGTVSIVAEDDFFPYTALRDEKSVGFGVDILKAAITAAGYTPEFRVMSYNRCMRLLDDGKEVGCFNTPQDDVLRQQYIFHEPQLYDAIGTIWGPMAYEGPDLSVKDLEGRKVGTTLGYPYGESFDNNTNIQKEVAPSDLLSLRKLATGRTEFAVVYDLVGRSLVAENADLKGKLKPIGSVVNIGMYVSFSKIHPDSERYASIVSEGIKKIKADGTYDKIAADWINKFK